VWRGREEKQTYVNFDSGVEEESFPGRMFERRVSVELEYSTVPFNAVERNVVDFVATVKLSTLPSSYYFRVN
jgi:hypothetical protein